MTTTPYDICILGAGISGLYCARELHTKYPTQSICILEKYNGIGGRIATFRKDGMQFEEGAGRIHASHHRILALLKEYKIALHPISDVIEYRTAKGSEPVEFGKYLTNLSPLHELPPDLLSKTTLKGLLGLILDPTLVSDIVSHYEYRSELDTLRADKAIEALQGELGDHAGFYVVKEGFSKVIHALKVTVERFKTVTILRSHEVTDLHPKDGQYEIQLKKRPSLYAKKVIVTLPRDALAALPCFKDLPILKHVEMRPLVRIYATFPLPKKGQKIWFDGLHSFICEPPVRYVIPLSPEKGTCMISYTDGSDAEYWIKHPTNPEVRCMKQIRALFPHLVIPDPIYCKVFSWSSGCSYWTPGTYTVKYRSQDPSYGGVSIASSYIDSTPSQRSTTKSHVLRKRGIFDFVPCGSTNTSVNLRPMPNVYLCGESWAEKQCWVESALETSTQVLQLL